MASHPPAPAPDAYWREHLRPQDAAAHAAEADRAAALEIVGLHERCAELAAALTQARAAITVRHQLLTDQSVALEKARARADQAQAALTEVLGSRRWRAAGTVAALVRVPRAVLNRLRGA
ncbi:hypothetical protein [Georgenia yuyongxinii]|uniref:Uncharacterized protein n=1 Tax=Georgenia yuyongxinii TaxID=2589797 RepID=A0A552WXV3_9MICO|nr:hypothetical protein [Georgenia yuyongxinii]TRW47671.1 hypothetical protein FJ693_00805 [Georgenia yuyongxinii]